MGKKSRARVAAAGTRLDPERRVVERDKDERADKEKKVGAHAHPDWAPHLNSASEDLTAKLFTMVEVILGVVPVVVIGLFLASKDATSVDKLTDVFSQDPSMVVTFISACLQPFVAYMLYMVYRKYCEGDAGFAAGNLIGLLCSEILLLNIPGVIGMGVLLWRVWRNVAPALSCRLLATEKLIRSLCAAPFGAVRFCGVPVFTIFVKLLVRFWPVGVRVDGQKITGEKSSKKVLVGELLGFSTVF